MIADSLFTGFSLVIILIVLVLLYLFWWRKR